MYNSLSHYNSFSAISRQIYLFLKSKGISEFFPEIEKLFFDTSD